MLNKLLVFIQALVYSLLFIFSGAIFVLNLRYTTHTDLITFSEQVVIAPHSVVLTLLLCMLLLAVSSLLFKIFSGLSSRAIRVILALSVLSAFALGVVLVRNNLYPPYADQQMVWDMAGYLTGHNSSMPYEYIPAYWLKYPQQKTLSVILAAFIRLTGNPSPYYFRLFNALAAALYVFGSFILTRKIFRNDAAALLAALVTGLFLPFYFYVNYVYSTLITMTAVLWSFICFITSQDIDDIPHGILCPVAGGLLLVFCNLFYKATLIATVAAVLYLLICAARKRFSLSKARLAGLIITAAVIILLPSPLVKISDREFEKRTGIGSHDGLPMTGWILMGIRSENGVNGPGSYDGSTEFLFADHNYNTAETDAEIREQLRETGREYLQGKRSLSFFLDKSVIQWCDPWFSSATMTVYPELIDGYDQNSLYPTLISEGILKNEEIVFSYVIPFVSLGAAIAAVMLLRRRKELDPVFSLPAMYFIGGFVFQFFWEAKSRYCLPYFLILIPFAAYGSSGLITFIRRIKTARQKRHP